MLFVVVQIMVELGFSHRAAFLASLFTILGIYNTCGTLCIIYCCIIFLYLWFNSFLPDNSLVIQSRVIMLDAFVIFLSYFSILCYLKFYHLRHR